MRPVLLFLITFAICGATFAQINTPAIEDPQLEDYMVHRSAPRITGRLLHATPEDIQKLNVEYSLVTLFEQEEMTAPIASDGSFQINIASRFPFQQIWFSIGDYFYAALIVNTELHIEPDLQKIKASGKCLYFNGDGVKYFGTDGALTDYYNNFFSYRHDEKVALKDRVFPLFQQQKPDSCQLVIDSIYQALKEIVDDYITHNPSPHAWLLEHEHLNECYTNLSVLYWFRTMPDSLFEKIKRHKTYVVTNNSSIFYRQLSVYLRNRPGIAVNSPMKKNGKERSGNWKCRAFTFLLTKRWIRKSEIYFPFAVILAMPSLIAKAYTGPAPLNGSGRLTAPRSLP